MINFLIEDEPKWQSDALCAQTDPEAFYPEETPGATLNAKKICSMCDVRAECLFSAISTKERWGIWGGYSYQDRREFAKSIRRSGEKVTEDSVRNWLETSRYADQ